jgi:hypothetical protein
MVTRLPVLPQRGPSAQAQCQKFETQHKYLLDEMSNFYNIYNIYNSDVLNRTLQCCKYDSLNLFNKLKVVFGVRPRHLHAYSSS